MGRKIQLTKTALYGYGVGNFGYGVILQAMTSYLVFFGTSILQVPGSLLGIVVSISVFWDAISDPIMGSISDFTRSKYFGRRHGYILFGCLGVAFFNSLLWSLNPEWSTMTKLILLTILIIGVKTLSTVYVTPYLALSGELSDDYYERNHIQSSRTVFFVLGLAFTVVIGMSYFLRATEEYPIGQLNPLGYRTLGVSMSVLMAVSGLITFFSTRRYIPILNWRIRKQLKTKQAGVYEQLKLDYKGISTNKNYLMVAFAYLSTNLASAIMGSIGLHVFTYTFRLDNLEIAFLFGSFYLFIIGSQPFWLSYAKEHDKKNTAIIATVIGLVSGVIFLGLVLIKHTVIGLPILMTPFFVLAGLSVGALLTLPMSMVCDTIDIEEARTGRRAEGLYYGGLTFAYKASQAIAIFFVGILLDLSGFDPSIDIQKGSTETALGLILAIGCLVAFGLTLLAYNRYNLFHGDIMKVQNELKEKMYDSSDE